jgi:hypothetical protein
MLWLFSLRMIFAEGQVLQDNGDELLCLFEVEMQAHALAEHFFN